MVTTLPRHSWGGAVFFVGKQAPPRGGRGTSFCPMPPFGDVVFIKETQQDKKIKSKKSSSELKLLIVNNIRAYIYSLVQFQRSQFEVDRKSSTQA